MLFTINNRTFHIDEKINKCFNLLQTRDLNENDIKAYLAACGYENPEKTLDYISNEELNDILVDCIKDEIDTFGGEGTFDVLWGV